MIMLDDVDFERRLSAIDWSVYEIAEFGSIREAMLGLLRSEPSARESWRDRLEMCLLPQSSLGAGAPAIVPFLLELLAERIASSEIYQLLEWMLWCTEDPTTGTLGTRARLAIRTGLDLFLRDFKDTAAPVGVRSRALAVAVALPEDHERWQLVLKDVHETEPNQDLRRQMENVAVPSGVPEQSPARVTWWQADRTPNDPVKS